VLLSLGIAEILAERTREAFLVLALRKLSCPVAVQVLGNVEAWTEHVKREKAVFHTLNMFNYDVTHKCLIAEGWCATAAINDVRDALRRGSMKSGATVQTVLNVVKTRETPPTYFKSTKLTAGFQAIVDAYGMASYQEFNPAVFTVVTFPFLFGVMFGDIGHGVMMALAGGLLCLFEKRLAAAANDEMFGTLYHGRYNILLMGVFAIYSGFIYNELFSVPQEFFAKTVWCDGDGDPQCQAVPGGANLTQQKWMRSNIAEAYDFETQTTLDKEVSWSVYPFGTDPGWAHTANKLNSVNSFKMKFAIVCGVAQMVAGICCKLMNALHFKDMLTLYFVWIPEIVFINSIFGYLVVLILIKWTTNWDATFILNNAEASALLLLLTRARLLLPLGCTDFPSRRSLSKRAALAPPARIALLLRGLHRGRERMRSAGASAPRRACRRSGAPRAAADFSARAGGVLAGDFHPAALLQRRAVQPALLDRPLHRQPRRRPGIRSPPSHPPHLTPPPFHAAPPSSRARSGGPADARRRGQGGCCRGCRRTCGA
jgi:vacuolar-type H+-ATPase subunit I/STV1